MSVFLNQNQFAQTPVIGMVENVPTPSIISVQIDPASSSSNLKVGLPVAITTAAANTIPVDAAGLTALKFGVIVYNPKKNVYSPGDMVEIAQDGSFIWLETSAAITKGAKVQQDPTNSQVLTLVSGTNAMIGYAMDTATAANQLIRVQLKFYDVNESAY